MGAPGARLASRFRCIRPAIENSCRGAMFGDQCIAADDREAARKTQAVTQAVFGHAVAGLGCHEFHTGVRPLAGAVKRRLKRRMNMGLRSLKVRAATGHTVSPARAARRDAEHSMAGLSKPALRLEDMGSHTVLAAYRSLGPGLARLRFLRLNPSAPFHKRDERCWRERRAASITHQQLRTMQFEQHITTPIWNRFGGANWSASREGCA